jgi:predicted molibdopterin-dependent oxidoreductase YjgC
MNDDIDDGWLSDITRYGYQIANSEERLKTPLIKKGGKQVEASWDEALALIAEKLKALKSSKGSPSIAGVVSPSLDLASLHCFNKLIRGALGANSVDYRSEYTALPAKTDTVYSYLASREFSIAAVDTSDAILVIGANLIREHPNVHLRVRKAVTKNQSWLYSANPFVTKSADCSTDEMIYQPGTDEAFLNGLTLSLIDQGLAKSDVDVSKINTLLAPNTVVDCAKVCGVSKERIDNCAKKLAEANSPSIIAGELITGSIKREKISNALFNLCVLLGVSLGDSGDKGQACILAHAANSKGAEALGLVPELSDEDRFRLARVIGELPELSGSNWDAILSGAQGEEIKALLVFGANPAQLTPDQRAVRKALESTEFLVVADLFETPTTQLADVVLPLCSFAEYDGAFTNLEGRQQDFTAARRPVAESLPGYKALNRIAEALGYNLYPDETTLGKEIADLLESYKAPTRRALLMESHHKAQEIPEESYPLFIGDALHHFGHWTEFCESLKSFDSKAALDVSHELADKLGLKTGDKVRVSSGDEKLNMKVRVSDLLEGETLFAPHNFAVTGVNLLRKADQRICYVRLKMIESSK